jgi:hypothetical protein
MLMFVRYAALLKQQGATVVVECPGILRLLLCRCHGIDRVIAEGEPLPPFDVHVPLMSLPHLLRTTLATVPSPVPYFTIEDECVEPWRRRLKPLGGFQVGIVWQGNPYHEWDRHRSVRLAHFEPMARVPGVNLISLQKVFGTEQLRAVAKRFTVTELEGESDRPDEAFVDTAAVMKQLDLVVTVDTAAAHLAGALGVAVWVALSTVSDWRWLRDRDDSPWYPTLRLFRQKRQGEWDDVFARMAAELGRRAQ